MEWTKPIIKKLIEMYRERPCLWQIKCESYKNKNLKVQCYEELAQFLRDNGLRGVDSKMVKEKIQNLRRAARKELSKVEALKKNDNVYTPNLWYYDLISFTNDQEETIPSINYLSPLCVLDEESNLKQIKEEKIEIIEPKYSHDILQDSNQQDFKTLSTSSSPIKKKIKLENTVDNDTKSDWINNTKEKPDEYEAIGINVSAKLKKMSLTQQIYAELLIQKVIAKGLLQQLNENVDLIDIRQSITTFNNSPSTSTVSSTLSTLEQNQTFFT